MSEKAYILNIYNTMTGEFELVQVTKEVFQTYRRTKWHIEDSTERFYKHETQMSSLIGGENDGYERFHEFIDYDNTPENQAIEEMVRQSLRNILDLLPPKDYELIYELYFKNRSETPRDANGQYDFESLGAMDVELFNADMTRLLHGETVEIPQFNFKKGVREYTGSYLKLEEQDVLVIEGIHCLNDQFTYSLPRESKYKIYISCLTTLNIDDHNRIPTTDARLLRRIERDARTRGYSAQATIRMWPSVRNGEENNIFPFQDSADVIFNSALVYETALLKPYVEPLLFGVPKDCEEYIEAKRLLKFLNYFLPIPADDVPRTSLMREFIGGGCYQV